MKHVVIDATMGCRDGLFTFCPIEGDVDGDFSVITGMNYISPVTPDGMKCVAIVHADGQDATEEFCKTYAKELEAI